MFLKLDTQGYNGEVLRGGARSLCRVLAIQSELSVQAIYEGVPSYTDAIASSTRSASSSAAPSSASSRWTA